MLLELGWNGNHNHNQLGTPPDCIVLGDSGVPVSYVKPTGDLLDVRMAFARLRGLWTTQAIRSNQLHTGNGLSTISDLCPRSRSSSNTQLPRRGRAVSLAIPKNLNAASFHNGYLHRRAPVLSTLDPDRLLPDDLLDLSGYTVPSIRFRETSEPGDGPPEVLVYKTVTRPRVFSTPELRRSARKTYNKYCPFPDNTRGFLYFRRSPHPHPHAGEVRFRLVRPEDDGLLPAERFRRGSDLMNYEGLAPWKIHALNTIHLHPVLRKKLAKEGLVPQVAEKGCLGRSRFRNDHIYDSITDPFIFHFGYERPNMTILREESIFAGVVYFGFCQHYAKLGGRGTAWVRFEMANLPCSQDPSKTVPRLVMRVLEFIEPLSLELSYPTARVFKEGELIQSYDPKSKRMAGPWAMTPLYEERILTPSSRKLLQDMYLNGSSS